MIKIRPRWIWLGIISVALLIIFLTKRRVDIVHNTQLHVDVGNDAPGANLYVPSPYEMQMIGTNKEVWPRRFGPQQPSQISDLPTIYNLFLKVRPTARDEIDFFRALAVTSSLGEWDAFKDLLTFRLQLKSTKEVTPKRLLTWVRSEKCSIMGQEIAYRVAIWSADRMDEVQKIFAACDPHSFHAFWLRTLAAQAKNDEPALRTLRDEAQSRREHLPTESFEFYLFTQAFTALDLKTAHGK